MLQIAILPFTGWYLALHASSQTAFGPEVPALSANSPPSAVGGSQLSMVVVDVVYVVVEVVLVVDVLLVVEDVRVEVDRHEPTLGSADAAASNFMMSK